MELLIAVVCLVVWLAMLFWILQRSPTPPAER
jgi:hypothetical protein